MSTLNMQSWTDFQKITLKLVKSGDEELNVNRMKRLKGMCKRKEVGISEVFSLLLKHLSVEHSQVRISTVQMIHEFFMRCHEFRLLVLDKIKVLVERTLALESNQLLPPPDRFHKRLKQVTIKSLNEWNKKFGPYYRKLQISVNFLEKKKRVDFKNTLALTDLEMKEKKKREQQEQNIRQFKIEKIIRLYDNKEDLFKDAISEANNCLKLLVPTINETDVTPSESKNNSSESNDVSGENASITISIQNRIKITENFDNSSLIHTLDDRANQITTALIPRLHRWIKDLIKNGAQQSDVIPIIKMKERMGIVIRKYSDLNIIRTNKRRRLVKKDADESDDDMVEVDEAEVLKDMTEERRMEFQLRLNKLDKIISGSIETRAVSPLSKHIKVVEDDEQPGPASLTSREIILNPEEAYATRSQDEIDEEELQFHRMALLKFESYHTFCGKTADTDDLDMESVRALNPDYRNVPGKFEPVKWSCRTPLPSGKLCPRMDRFKCPLHGRVIPRDKEGRPNKDRDLFKKEEMIAIVTSGKDWKAVEGEVEAATGKKLNHSKKRKRNEGEMAFRSDNYVPKSRATSSTPRTRLENKIFDKKTIRRANAKADEADDKRGNDRFGQQFHYRDSVNG